MSNPKGNESSLKKFKPKWKNGTTHTIRVPIALTEQILEYAHKLDESPTQVNHSDTNSAIAIHQDKVVETLTQAIRVLDFIHVSSKLRKDTKDRLRTEALEPLQALIQTIQEPLPILEAIAAVKKPRKSRKPPSQVKDNHTTPSPP